MARKISRRDFLKLASGTSLFGLGVLASGCASEQKDEGGDGWMPDQYQGRGDFPAHLKGRVAISPKNPSIMRDDEKCILCGQCIEACHNVIGVHGYYPLPLKDETACIGCGQCTMWCPTGAIHERPAVDQVEAALDDDSKFVVVQTAPATKVSLGEEFGMAPGSIVGGKQVAALRALGFDAVFDTCMSADMTIMEEASEALVRLTQKKDVLPHFTSCCPGWVRFCELFYPDLMKHLSTCKSPAAMMGATVKSYYAEKKGLDPKNIVTVSIMPCTAKKGEALRKELGHDDMQDVDYVLTTRELARLLKKKGIDFESLDNADYDSILGESSGAGRIFGATGGVAEASVRSLYYFATHQAPPANLLEWKAVRGLTSVKEAQASVPGVGTVSVAVVNGMASGRKVLDAIRAGQGSRWQFIEFMACPGGCIGGGGQPKSQFASSEDMRQRRIAALYQEDRGAKKRASHENAEIQTLYKEFYGQPLSERAEKYLHTSFVDQSEKIFDAETQHAPNTPPKAPKSQPAKA